MRLSRRCDLSKTQNQAFNRLIIKSLSKKYIGSDEKVFDITYCKNKHKYNLIQCTWRTYFDLFKESKKTGPHMKLKLVTTTWSHQDTFEIENFDLLFTFPSQMLKFLKVTTEIKTYVFLNGICEHYNHSAVDHVNSV